MKETLLVHKELAKTFGSTEFISSMDALKGYPNELLGGIVGLLKEKHSEREISLNDFGFEININIEDVKVTVEMVNQGFIWELKSFSYQNLGTEEEKQITSAYINFFLSIYKRISSSFEFSEFGVRWGRLTQKEIGKLMNASLKDKNYFWYVENDAFGEDMLRIEKNPKRIQAFKNARKIKEYFVQLSETSVLDKDGMMVGLIHEYGMMARLMNEWYDLGEINVRYKYLVTVKMKGNRVIWEIDKGDVWNDKDGESGVFTNEMLKSQESFVAAIYNIVSGMELEECMLEQDLTTPLRKIFIKSKEEHSILFEKVCEISGMSYNEMCIALHKIELDNRVETLEVGNNFELGISQKVKNTDENYTVVEASVNKFNLKVKEHHLVIYRGELSGLNEREDGRFIYDIQDGGSFIEDESYKKQVLNDLYEMTIKGLKIRKI